MMNSLRCALVLTLGLFLSACASVENGPINSFVSEVGPGSPEFIPDFGDDGSTVLGLAFSGGGTRAAAFAYGVMRELDSYVIDLVPRQRTLLDDVRMVSGTSGGAIAAAYLAYRGQDAYRDFRERFLLQNAEASMRTSTRSPANLLRAIGGGVNDLNNLPQWLNDNLFDGATFGSLRKPDTPVTWITASDIFHGTPFLFTYDTFAALCSDLDKVRLADAVAASAAVPVIFTPIVLSSDGPDCGYRRPAWIDRALADPEASLRLSAYARALVAYSEMVRPRYVRLLDGGLTDNTGTTGLTLERAAATTPHGPLSAEDAVKLRTMIYIAVDAGRSILPDWGDSTTGPKLSQLVPALTHTAVSSSMRSGYDALELSIAEWRRRLIAFRCGLGSAQVKRYRGTLAGWNCRDVQIVVEHISFRDVAPERQQELFDVPTRLVLQPEQVDLVIEAGREAVKRRISIQRAVARTRIQAGVPAAAEPPRQPEPLVGAVSAQNLTD